MNVPAKTAPTAVGAQAGTRRTAAEASGNDGDWAALGFGRGLAARAALLLSVPTEWATTSAVSTAFFATF